MFAYASQYTFSFAGSPGARDIYDYNGDGKLDLVVSGPQYDRTAFTGAEVPFRFFTIESNGTITERPDQISGSAIHAFEGFTSDFNNDGFADFFSINSGFDTQPWAGEHSSLFFGSPTGLKGGDLRGDRVDFHHSGDIGDIDNDGDTDIFSGTYWSKGHWAGDIERQGPYALSNDGQGNFALVDVGLATLPYTLTSSKLADMDHDGDLDLIAGWDASSPISGTVYYNSGKGQFTKGADLGVGRYGANETIVNEVQTIDYDRDGDLDIVMSQTNKAYQNSAVQVWRNDGGSFADVTDALGMNNGISSQLGWIHRLHVMDINADGIQDIVVARTQDYGSIYLGTRSGGFEYVNGQQQGVVGVQWTPADVNGDGLPDLVTFSRDVSGSAISDMTLRVYLNNSFNGGSAGNDTFVTSDGDETLTGRQGDDFIHAQGGNDVIYGGDGFDNMHGNKGEDSMWGGRGNDWVVGGQGGDTLSGDEGNDIVYGNMGNDTVDGGVGADTIRGGQDDDWMRGGDGNDWMSGDRGNDTISGGAGADTFNFFVGSGIDRVLDFGAGDRVQLEGSPGYAIRYQGTDTIIDLGAGDLMILVGVHMTGSGWIT